MTPQDKDKIMKILQQFVNDNLGQLVTTWNGGALIGTVSRELDAICSRNTRPPLTEEEVKRLQDGSKVQ